VATTRAIDRIDDRALGGVRSALSNLSLELQTLLELDCAEGNDPATLLPRKDECTRLGLYRAQPRT
jgi:hypothetical protein